MAKKEGGEGGFEKDLHKEAAGETVSDQGDGAYEDMIMQITGKSSDAFIDQHLEALRLLGKRAIAGFSYRVGMADLLDAFESEFGKEKAELALRALERKNRRRKPEPEFEYIGIGGEGCGEEDVVEDHGGDDPSEPVLADWRERKRAVERMKELRRRLRGEDWDGDDPVPR